MKTYILPILVTMTATAGATPFQAWAEEEEIPFAACKNVRIVKSVAEVKQLEDLGCRAALDSNAMANSIQAKTGTGKKLSDAMLIGGMLETVAQKEYLPTLKKRQEYWISVKKCFDDKTPSDSCKQTMATIKGTYGGFVGKLRQSLAQTQLTKSGNKLQPSSSLSAGDSKSVYFIPNAYPDAVLGQLHESEKKAVQASVSSLSAGKQKETAEAADKKYIEDLAQGIQTNGLYLVAFLPKPSSAAADGTPEWSNEEWSKTVKRLVDEATNEEVKTKNTIKAGVVSFPGFRTSDLVPYWGGEKRDMMYYATLTPVMNRHLEKNPQDCGLALAAVDWMKSNEWVKLGGTFAVGVPLGMGAGAGARIAGMGFNNAKTIGRTLMGVSLLGGGGWSGAMMTANEYVRAQDKADASFRTVAKIGAEKGQEEDLIDPKELEKAQEAAKGWWKQALITNAALGGGIVAGGGAVLGGFQLGKLLVSKSKKTLNEFHSSLLQAEKPRELVKGLSRGLNDAPGVSAEGKANAAAILGDPGTDRALLIAENAGPAFRRIAGKLDNPAETAEIGDLITTSHAQVAKKLEAEGACKGGACDALAAKKQGEALDEAGVACGLQKGKK